MKTGPPPRRDWGPWSAGSGAADPARVLRPPRPPPSALLRPPPARSLPPRTRLDQSSGISCSGAAPPAEPPRSGPSAPSSPHGRGAAGGAGPGRGPRGNREGPSRGLGRGPERPRRKGPGASSGPLAASYGDQGSPAPQRRAPRDWGAAPQGRHRDRSCPGALPRPVAPGARGGAGTVPGEDGSGRGWGPGVGAARPAGLLTWCFEEAGT